MALIVGVAFGRSSDTATLRTTVYSSGMSGYSTKGRATNHLLFCNPASTRSRERLTLRQSRDGGVSWSSGTILESGLSAYSDIVIMPRKQVGVLFECGGTSPYERIDFCLVDKRKLK